ncbi:cysteine desulfurase [Paraburkholderia caballeronis]|uniref:cysteine desulfurase family protein n=1 Tax=Paraburkholderia caballeronis TaxID=416943 RepID=UPI001066577A|nr:cysteine desulfurase family protein [Paraburkholderia caballeronis]TDV26870.1 cysteine desulfurase [Paraburkholderia caballeronis]
MIYLDHNATTPPSAGVVQAVLATMTDVWGNASSQHPHGQQAKRALGAARASVARVLGCKPSETIFTSGATEANHLAVLGLHAAARHAGRDRIVFSAVEHAGHLALAQALIAQRLPVDFIGVNADGTLDLDSAARAIGPDVAVVSLMAANNETGVLMPVDDVRALAQAAGARLHVDATQFVGKAPFDFARFGADAVSLSAHKLGGPKGIGALLLRQGIALQPQLHGSQERRRRGGTENLPAVAGFAAALEGLGDVAAKAARIAQLRDALEQGLQRALPHVHVFAAGAPRVAGTSYLRFGALPSEVVLQRLEQLGVCASSGAACSSGGSEPSHVLTAMGVPRDEALAAVRLSLGATTSARDIDYLLAALPPLLAPLLENDAAHAA